MLPPEVVSYLDRLREIGASERAVGAERDAWILVEARWPGHVREWMPGKLALLDDPRYVRLYRLSGILESDTGEDLSRAEEAADILAGLLEEDYTAGESKPDWERDDLFFDLLDALILESDPRMQRLMDLLCERGWARWTRPDRLAEPPPPARVNRPAAGRPPPGRPRRAGLPRVGVAGDESRGVRIRSDDS